MKFFLLSLAVATFFSSCNTMVGVRRDTRILGESVEKSAEKSATGSSSENYDTGAAPIY